MSMAVRRDGSSLLCFCSVTVPETVPGTGPKSHNSLFHSQMARVVEPRAQDSYLA